jgi:hypothetical protein
MGVAKTKISISIAASMNAAFAIVDKEQTILNRQLGNIINLLPPDTTVVSVNKLPMMSICSEYEVELSSNFFKDGSEIVPVYRRYMGTDPTIGVIQTNLLISLNFDDFMQYP